MKTGSTIATLAQTVMQQANSAKDLIVSTRDIVATPLNRSIALNIAPADMTGLELTKNMHSQIQTHTGIAAKYYQRMADQAPDLLATNINHWFQREPERKMVRTLPGTARALLSDRYHRRDNWLILQAIAPIFESSDVIVQSCEVTENRLYIKATFPKVQREVKVGDIVEAGICVRNSETGNGSTAVLPLVHRLICKNGAIMEDYGLRKNHVGRKIDSLEDFSIYRGETTAADDRAFIMKLQDSIAAAMNEARFDRMVQTMTEAANSTQIKEPAPAVEMLSKTLRLTDGEQSSVLERLINWNDFTKWGLANAVTNLANDVPNYERATELETAGFEIIQLDPRAWTKIAEATA